MYKRIYNNKGFSLVEVIVALGVFSILAAAVFNVATNTYGNFYGTGDKQVIAEFAQEGIEAVRAIRDNSWQDIEDAADTVGTHGVSRAVEGYWEFTGAGSGSDTLGVLNRTTEISDVSRDSNDEIVDSGGTDDPNTKKVVITVIGTGISDYTLTAYILNWSYKTWLQTDWSGSEDREFWADSTMASSSYSNINTSTPGRFFLAFTSVHLTPGYLYSSIYDLAAHDREIQSITVEQSVPSGCNLDITLETSNLYDFSSISSYLFSDDSTTTYYTSSTPASLNGKRYMRYKVDMDACDSDLATPTLYSIKINYR